MSMSCSSRVRPWFRGFASLLVLVSACSGPAEVVEPAPSPWTADRVLSAGQAAANTGLAECVAGGCGVRLVGHAGVDSVQFDPASETLVVEFRTAVAESSWREEGVNGLREAIRRALPVDAPVDRIEMRALGLPLEELVPNVYRSAVPVDASRKPAQRPEPRPLVTRSDGPAAPTRGLHGRHIALWHSHGWYYEPDLDRWEWQRARLFTTVEDILPASFVLPFLAPMLERSGATVWMPRERDTQTHMVVVDNDGSTGGSTYAEAGPWEAGLTSGFAVGSPPYGPGVNPFGLGSWRSIAASPASRDSIVWHADIEEAGDYAVYVSWGRHPGAIPDARYLVRHAGGTTALIVDQSMAYGTWVYLGTFPFASGADVDSASVTLRAIGSEGGRVSADAVRFGGGTGLVTRGGAPSGRPRWQEAARYALQYAGMPDSVVYHVTGEADDYGDDYRSRGEWVNFLRGRPFGPNGYREMDGLGVPVDLSLAFHTDAGVAAGDTTIGTLLIYSGPGADTTRVFPDGMSRFSNRDFADMLQTQIVRDIRATYDSSWTRRSIWDRPYAEAVRPNVPGALLELLSHQNFADMRLGLDPAFRFDVSRSIYKAMARFLAAQYGEPDPVIQPLPPDHLEARVLSPGTVRVRWRAVDDPLEPSATADRFMVYTRTGEGGYDNGRLVEGRRIDVPVEAHRDYAFRVTALNEGGESFPSEEVAASWVPGRPRVLVVSAFDRVSAPAAVDHPPFRGFLDLLDHGVADGYDLSFVGAQHEFDVGVPWRDDDDPGHGASFGSHETRVVPGNTRDFARLHGRSARRAGFGYDTVSDERFVLEPGSADGYAVIDLLLGEERETTPGLRTIPEFRAFPSEMTDALRSVAETGTGMLVSGSYVGSELWTAGPSSDARRAFAADVLGIRHRTGNAVATGRVVPVLDRPIGDGMPFQFRTDRSPDGYEAEAPDAVEPAGWGSRTVFRYGETNMSAGVAFEGAHRAVTLGFPLETIRDETDRDRVMASLLAWLTAAPDRE